MPRGIAGTPASPSGRKSKQKTRGCVISDERKVVAISLIDSGMPIQKVEDITGISERYLADLRVKFAADRQLVEFYKKNKADILLRAQMKDIVLQDVIRDSLNEKDISGWTSSEKQRWFSALGLDMGIKFDKERLESGQSTENVGVVVKAIHEWKKMKEEGENA